MNEKLHLPPFLVLILFKNTEVLFLFKFFCIARSFSPGLSQPIIHDSKAKSTF